MPLQENTPPLSSQIGNKIALIKFLRAAINKLSDEKKIETINGKYFHWDISNTSEECSGYLDLSLTNAKSFIEKYFNW